MGREKHTESAFNTAHCVSILPQAAWQALPNGSLAVALRQNNQNNGEAVLHDALPSIHGASRAPLPGGPPSSLAMALSINTSGTLRVFECFRVDVSVTWPMTDEFAMLCVPDQTTAEILTRLPCCVPWTTQGLSPPRWSSRTPSGPAPTTRAVPASWLVGWLVHFTRARTRTRRGRSRSRLLDSCGLVRHRASDSTPSHQ